MMKVDEVDLDEVQCIIANLIYMVLIYIFIIIIIIIINRSNIIYMV